MATDSANDVLPMALTPTPRLLAGNMNNTIQVTAVVGGEYDTEGNHIEGGTVIDAECKVLTLEEHAKVFNPFTPDAEVWKAVIVKVSRNGVEIPFEQVTEDEAYAVIRARRRFLVSPPTRRNT